MSNWTKQRISASIADKQRVYASSPLCTAKNAVIIPLGTYPNNISSLVKYDTLKKKCSKFMQFKEPLPCRYNSLSIDQDNEAIYVPFSTGIYKIDLKSKEPKLILKLSEEDARNHGLYGQQNGVTSCIIDNQLQICDG